MQNYQIADRCRVCGTPNPNRQPFCARCRSDLRIMAPAGQSGGGRYGPPQQRPPGPPQQRPPAPPQQRPPGPPHQRPPGPPQQRPPYPPQQRPGGPPPPYPPRPQPGGPPPPAGQRPPGAYGPPPQQGPPRPGQPPQGPWRQPPPGQQPYGRPPQQPYGGRPYAATGSPYAQVSRQYVAGVTPHKSHSPWPWLGAIAGVVFAIVLISVVAVVVSNNGKGTQPTPCANPCKNPPPGKGPTPPKNPPKSAPPAEGAPVSAQHTYTSSSLGYQVQYNDAPLSEPWLGQASNGSPAPMKVVAQDDHQLGFVYDLGSFRPNGSPWFVPAQYPFGYNGVPASGKSSQQLVTDYVNSVLPGAEKVYDIPNASVGYEPGYGAVYDVTARTPDGQSFHARAMVVGAVKGDTGVIVSGVGYYFVETQGHPNPADTTFAHFWSILPAQVTFKGEQPL